MIYLSELSELSNEFTETNFMSEHSCNRGSDHPAYTVEALALTYLPPPSTSTWKGTCTNNAHLFPPREILVMQVKTHMYESQGNTNYNTKKKMSKGCAL